MDTARHDPLARLVALGTSSLLQYVGESSPWSPRESAAPLQKVLDLAGEERDETTRFTRILQKKHIRLPPMGAYPSHFTTMNFVTVDYLVPKLIGEHVREIAEIERILSQIDDEEIRCMAQGYLDMKRRHLETLKVLASSKTPAPMS